MKKRMKKRMIFFAAGVLSAALCLSVLAGCTDLSLSDSKESANSVMGGGNYGSLTVVPSGSGRALDVSELKYASVTVSGTGIPSGSEPSRKNVELSGGKGTVTVSNIPVGKNRIVTVQAFSNSDGAKIDGVRIRAVTDISEGGNSVIVDWNTTALGNVFASLYEKSIDISAVSADDKLKIQNAIDTTVNASLINASAIADDYISGVEKLKGKAEYVLAPANLTFSYTELSSYKVQVTDPSSAVATCSSGTQTVSNIAPGTWSVYILNEDGTVVLRKPLNVFKTGETLDLGNLDAVILTDIIVHAESKYKYIWYWKTGEQGQGAELKDEGNGWFGYTFENTESMNMIFRFNGENWDGQTSNLSRNEPGEYWFKNGQWYDYNPDKPVTPVIKADIKSGTYLEAQTVTLTGSNASDIIYYTTDGTEPTLSSSVYSSPIKVSKTMTIKAFGYNKGAEPQSGSVYEFAYKIDPNADLVPPVITPSHKAGKYTENISFNFTITDNKTGGFKVYYTTDGSVPTVESSVYAEVSAGTSSVKGNDLSVTVGNNITVKLLAVDAAGNQSGVASYFYRVTDGTESTDFREETIYFLMTTRFYDGDPLNNRYCWDDESCFNSETLGDPGWRGDFKGLIEKLDYIKALGFTAIWITPVVENASGLDYHGYHAFDFSRVDPRYESSGATYQDLIDACHSKGIKVIQDIVLNHTGNFGERNLLPIMKKNYSDDDGLHSVPAVPDHDSKDIYGNSAYEKLSKGAKLQGFDKYEDIEASSLTSDKKGGALYQSRLMTMKNDDIDTDEPGRLYHHYGNFEWESYYVQEGQMAGDCVDLNTENPVVAKYLRDCYINYINMGVDGFRIDTMKHISRLTMNKEFIPYFREAGGDGFFMFGEGCVLRNEVWNSGMPGISIPFYTWNQNSLKTDNSYSWETQATGAAANLLMAKTHFDDNTVGVQLTSNNAFLIDNTYHAPDYSKASGLHMIDFYMHHGFENAGAAFSIAKIEDSYFNDATYNVMYVDSHDYGPNSGGYLYTRYSGGTEAWAGNFNLMFTFRGIPCVYYGSEIEFQKNMQIEPYTNGNKVPYSQSGRAYFGDHLEGTVNATDFGEYTASGEVANTLNYELAQHLIRLNKIRRAIPALQKGQYSTEGCSGSIAFKRRYTDDTVDSFALVTINGGATFSNIPGGKYVEVITGQTADVSEGGSITTDSIDSGNMRVYVNTSLKGCDVSGKIGTDGEYLK